MGKYVDGFVIPIPKKNLNAYKKMAKMGAKVWMKYGALEYFECVGDDLKGMPGCLPFPKGIRARKGETVVFSWIVYKSKKHQKAVNAKVMKDPSMNAGFNEKSMPFDMKRMMYGAFKTIVNR
ncbi:MAG TPA: DUF1428 domain-containing protein [archaeon]|nr:DUF1428 domain-containing protein [archaeon]